MQKKGRQRRRRMTRDWARSKKLWGELKGETKKPSDQCLRKK
jgi:hypothetical protein